MNNLPPFPKFPPFPRSGRPRPGGRSHAMTPAKIGARVRVVANTCDHNYPVGSLCTVVLVDSDGTFKARTPDGKVGNWLRWRDCRPGSLSLWDLLKKELPPDIRLFLSSFDGIEDLELKEEVVDAILAGLPDLDERIVAFARTEEGAQLLGHEPAAEEA
jgi:hypothetical protein